MIGSLELPKQEVKMLPLKLESTLESVVRDFLSKEIETPSDIPGYPDLRLFSHDDLKRSDYSLRVYGEVDYEGRKFFVGPKIEQES